MGIVGIAVAAEVGDAGGDVAEGGVGVIDAVDLRAD